MPLRIPERTLHLLAFLGGWPGALLGQRFFRHKTKKLSFLIAFWAVVALHVAIVGSVAYAILSRGEAATAPLSTIPDGRIDARQPSGSSERARRESRSTALYAGDAMRGAFGGGGEANDSRSH